MTVLGYDPFIRSSQYDGPARIEESLDSVLRNSDFVTLHVSLTPDTRHMLNDQTLGVVKPGCRIINTSRGAVIDERALVSALRGGTIAGAALDVFETEPLQADHPLCQAPNTLLTPHISSSTCESLDCMARDAAQGVLDVIQGRTPGLIKKPEDAGIGVFSY